MNTNKEVFSIINNIIKKSNSDDFNNFDDIILTLLEKDGFLITNYTSNKNKTRSQRLNALKNQKTYDECTIIKNSKNEKCDMLNENAHLFYPWIQNINLLNDIKNDLILLTHENAKNIYKQSIYALYKIFNPELTSQLTKLSDLIFIDDSHKYIEFTRLCIIKRIQYYYMCSETHAIKFNLGTHKIELLQLIYLYDKIIEIKNIINDFIDKYTKVRKNAIKQLYIFQKTNEFNQKKRILKNKKGQIEEKIMRLNNVLNDRIDDSLDYNYMSLQFEKTKIENEIKELDKNEYTYESENEEYMVAYSKYTSNISKGGFSPSYTSNKSR